MDYEKLYEQTRREKRDAEYLGRKAVQKLAFCQDLLIRVHTLDSDFLPDTLKDDISTAIILSGETLELFEGDEQ